MDIRAMDSTNSAIRNKTITTAYNGIAPFSRQPNKVFTRRERERDLGEARSRVFETLRAALNGHG